jgi:hypothetical protein
MDLHGSIVNMYSSALEVCVPRQELEAEILRKFLGTASELLTS